MKNLKRIILIAGIVISTLCAAWSPYRRVLAKPLSAEEDSMTEALKAFGAIGPIDDHTHIFKPDPAFQAFIERVHLTVLDILVVDGTSPYHRHLEPQRGDALAAVHASRGHLAFCTTFDAYKFNRPDFATEAIRQLDQDFAEGAIAVKVWKNIGMELKNTQGAFVMPDDPKFGPIYRDIAKHGKTLMMHTAEPDSCWAPLDPAHPQATDEYYRQHPYWYMGDKPDRPSKAKILSARDRVIAENPKLRVVGAHLGSMEMDMNDVARHLDRYPNFAVDIGGRTEYLMTAPHEQVRAFLIKYQDRIMYGTDLTLANEFGPHTTQNVQEVIKEWEKTYAQDWTFFATDRTVDYGGKKIPGLKLPQSVLRKVFRENAIRWFPGIVP